MSFEPLTDAQLSDFKQQLLDLKQDSQQDLIDGNHSTGVVNLDQQSVGRLSRMDAMQNQQMALESQRRSQLQLIAIEKALKRIENGTFGLCEECDEWINPKRLAVNPTVTLCIECAR